MTLHDGKSLIFKLMPPPRHSFSFTVCRNVKLISASRKLLELFSLPLFRFFMCFHAKPKNGNEGNKEIIRANFSINGVVWK